MDHYLTLIQESTKYGLKTYLKPQAMKVLEENIEKILCCGQVFSFNNLKGIDNKRYSRQI